MDGTLLRGDSTVSQKNKDSIAKWIEKGGHFGFLFSEFYADF